MAKDYGNEKQRALDLKSLERLIWQSYGDVRLVRLCTVVLASFDFRQFLGSPQAGTFIECLQIGKK